MAISKTRTRKYILTLKFREENVCSLADEGEGFDYNRLPDPTAPENLENLTGRGVFIIKHLADQCIFNLKGNEVELHFKV
jgi:serine/threonine-protein kinase RsbW